MKHSITIFLLLPILSMAQPNCNAFLYNGDTLQYQACKLVEGIDKKYYQFSKEYQEVMDEALRICPYFAYAYREKGSAYIKSGDFLTWKKLIDQAVKYAPLEYLSIRASLKYKFFADYEGTIEDINLLDSMIDYDIGSTSNGTYHLNIVKALCYKKLGQKNEAIKILRKQIKTESYIGIFDYLHLGVLYLETGLYDEALVSFDKQEKFNNLAENQYYKALVFKKLGQVNSYINCLEESKMLYFQGSKMHDPYSQIIDEIYLTDIEKELITAYNNL